MPGILLTDIDGLYLINDGYQTIAALKEIEQAVTSGMLEELVQNISTVLEKGVEMDVKSYPPVYSRDVHVAWMTLLHDSDQNKYRPTSIYQKISVIERYVKKAPGGDLKHAPCY